MIKAVIFDYGNVISQTQTGDCAAQMEAMTGVPAQVFRTVYDRFRFEFDRGTITGAQMYRQLLEADGYHQQAADQQLMEQIARLDMEKKLAERDRLGAFPEGQWPQAGNPFQHAHRIPGLLRG